ncbi:MAG: 23S rRNA (uracil(1939)-C(5))-methyltransferase RlmD [Firmicutes bacterium]|nr:23S rRNA (uracil(1939)-C(5))-methyltransferase RlmD [Bacillota bacterium]
MTDYKCSAEALCGGCSLLGISYEKQLAAKQAQVQSLLSRFAPVEPILGMDNPLYYRNKVHRVVSRTRQGQIICGNYEAGTHRVVPVRRCLIEDLSSQLILDDLAKLLQSFRLPVYDEDRRTGLIRHLLVRRGFSTGEIMVVIVSASPVLPSRKNFVKALLDLHPEISTLILNVNSRKTNMILGDRNIPLYGKGWISDRLCGLTFRLSPGSFYQVNPKQTEVLYRTAIEMAGLTGSESILDAYCGIGTIGLAAAERAARIVGVELSPEGVRDARINARENRIAGASFVQADATEWILQASSEGASFDAVFLDPPRAGTTPGFIQAVCRLSPPRVVYVSCNPATLARDLELFEAQGYRAEKIQPVDMFPFTEHIETVTLITRAERDYRLGVR